MIGYDDMIALPHHVSSKRPPMSRVGRAAQFSPFAALTGYEAAISETARLTDAKIELTEESRGELDRKQQCLMQMVDARPEIKVTYFLPDARKSGGSYQSVTGRFKGIDPVARLMLLTEGVKIPLDDILELESDVIK